MLRPHPSVAIKEQHANLASVSKNRIRSPYIPLYSRRKNIFANIRVFVVHDIYALEHIDKSQIAYAHHMNKSIRDWYRYDFADSTFGKAGVINNMSSTVTYVEIMPISIFNVNVSLL